MYTFHFPKKNANYLVLSELSDLPPWLSLSVTSTEHKDLVTAVSVSVSRPIGFLLCQKLARLDSSAIEAANGSLHILYSRILADLTMRLSDLSYELSSNTYKILDNGLALGWSDGGNLKHISLQLSGYQICPHNFLGETLSYRELAISLMSITECEFTRRINQIPNETIHSN